MEREAEREIWWKEDWTVTATALADHFPLLFRYSILDAGNGSSREAKGGRECSPLIYTWDSIMNGPALCTSIWLDTLVLTTVTNDHLFPMKKCFFYQKFMFGSPSFPECTREYFKKLHFTPPLSPANLFPQKTQWAQDWFLLMLLFCSKIVLKAALCMPKHLINVRHKWIFIDVSHCKWDCCGPTVIFIGVLVEPFNSYSCLNISVLKCFCDLWLPTVFSTDFEQKFTRSHISP